MKIIPPPPCAAAVSAVFAFAAAAHGETIRLTANDAPGASSFTNFNVSSTVKYGAPSSANDYVVEGFTIRTPAASATFDGNSLMFGNAAASKAGNMAFTCADKAVVTFGNQGAWLSRGRFCPYVRNRQYTLAGTLNVASPRGYPFVLEWSADKSNNNANNTFIITAAIHGGADTELAIASETENTSGQVTFAPDASSTFSGLLTIGSIADHKNAYRSANDTMPVVCEYRNSMTWPGTIQVKGESVFRPLYSSEKWTIGSLVLDAGSTLLTKLADASTSTITLTNSLVTTYPVNLVTPSARTSTASTAKSTLWPVLTLPTDKGDLGDNVGDFVLATQPTLFPDSLPAISLTVTTNGSVASLNLKQRQIVRLVFGDEDNSTNWRATGSQTAVTNAAFWSDSAVPHPDADYVFETSSKHLCFPPTELLEDSFYASPDRR